MDMSQKLPVERFKWVQNTSPFSKYFIETIMKIVMKDIFLKLMFNILKNDMTFTIFSERMNLEKVEKLVALFAWQTTMCYTHKKFKTSIRS